MGRPAIIEPRPVPLPDGELMARLFRALGDATRIAILELLLEEGAKTQKEILTHVDLSQGRVSQHLACLTWCGFVTAEKTGREVIYQVASPRVGSLVDLARIYLENTNADIASCRVVD